MASPSMVHRSGDTLVVRSVVSGDQLFVNHEPNEMESEEGSGNEFLDMDDESKNLPECKIRRNYSCNSCHYFTQNPRHFLYHLRDVHKEKVKIYECPHCLYASKHFQKLLRHMKMVHGGFADSTHQNQNQRKVRRKRKRNVPIPISIPIPIPIEEPNVEEEEESEQLINENDPNDGDFDDELTLSKTSPSLDLKCSLCSFTTRHQGQLTRHERQEHIKTKFFRCTKCSYVTHIKARFTKHVKYHSMPMIKCDLCDFRTPYKWNLDRHYKNHNGHGAFRCSCCNFTADIKQSLTVHEMNHHVPPVGQAAGLGVGRRRNKVGASDATAAEEATNEQIMSRHLEQDFCKIIGLGNGELKDIVKNNPRNKNVFNKKTRTSFSQEQNERHHFETDFIHPDDIIHHSNGNIYIKNKCKYCNFKSAWNSEMMKHEQKVHNIVRNEQSKTVVNKVKKTPRPIPNLIPIQLKSPGIQNRNMNEEEHEEEEEEEMGGGDIISQKDLNDMCAKSVNSALRDFASLLGEDVTFGTESEVEMKKEKPVLDTEAVITPISTNKTSSSLFKKKNASFFDKLKEKLMTDAGESCNLTCKWCGHESKCLSESAGHQKTCGGKQQINLSNNSSSGVNSTNSTRCQHCRQRCKSSLDLHNHLQLCSEATRSKTPKEIYYEKPDITIKLEEERVPDEPHPMENVVFVWNTISPTPNEDVEEERNLMDHSDEINSVDLSIQIRSPISEASVIECENVSTPIKMPTHGNDIDLVADGRRVFRCPHCSFWATTASRFHVHIVGHLNKKPFECSLCSYRSNWRWDITKHIRLKSVRDPEHEKARVLMTDETGRRNYSKYNKYLTQLRSSESSPEQMNARKSKSAETTPVKKLFESSDFKSVLDLPKLVKAPSNNQFLSSGTSRNNPLRPPPPLKAANEILFQRLNEENKKKNSDAKKTIFKCKKCNYRDANRETILLHVKGHYLRELYDDGSNADLDEASVLRGNAPFRCGHCHQVSNWKHVIQRHCRLKHSGDVRVVIGGKNGITEKVEVDDQSDEPDHVDVLQNGTHKCQQCPFSVNAQSEFDTHLEMHVPKPEAAMKCYFCPYYVVHKYELFDHLKLHGVSNPEDYVNRAMQGSELTSPLESTFKRYKCACCPYVSNSKSQFMYHKQFHRHRGGTFKCEYCSYNVTRRHLLHQHLRVHGIVLPSHKASVKNGSEDHESDLMDTEDIAALDDFEELLTPPNYREEILDDIPLVWVSRNGKFSKMFKCRYCPHLNLRKVNIQEHEKMHNGNRKSNSPRTNLEEHHCPECNYICNNAGVLSSHLKVHQFLHGQIHCLVDLNKSDEEQISELTRLLNIPETVEESSSYLDDDPDPDPTSDATSVDLNLNLDGIVKQERLLYFCEHCPARFLHEKEFAIHTRFHGIRLFYRCDYCSYAARQRPHLLAHNKVHTDEYQERTRQLQSEFNASNDHAPPRTAVIIDGPGVDSGSIWVVISTGDKQVERLIENKTAIPLPAPVHKPSSNKNFACVKCPARFFKDDLLKYHMTLHGCNNPYKCYYCDYAARTSSNLQKHARIHQQDVPVVTKPQSLIGTVPLSGTDLFKQKSEAQKQNLSRKTDLVPVTKHVDPQFGTLMHGNPKFIYPTYLKNGRMKEKRYKCHKCPSAFEKREQYRVHLTLHGSKQRYKCENCDYSVKYYANYMQHVKKHQMNEDAHAAKRSEVGAGAVDVNVDLDFDPDLDLDPTSETINEDSIIQENSDSSPFSKLAIKSLNSSSSKRGPLKLSVADRQTFMILQQRRTSNASNSTKEVQTEDKKIFWCPHCPYTNHRRDSVDNHVNRHICVSGVRSNYTCDHCDYTVPQSHFLRDHVKIHFTGQKRHQPEAYMVCHNLELSTLKNDDNDHDDINDHDNRKMIFQDHGEYENASKRFKPDLDSAILDAHNNNNGGNPTSDTAGKIFINHENGDILEMTS